MIDFKTQKCVKIVFVWGLIEELKKSILKCWHIATVTRWADYFQYLAILNNKTMPKAYKICQSITKIFQNAKYILRNVPQDFKKNRQSGENLPNLVTLHTTY